MRLGSWGQEPFDLRLTILRMIRCLPGIMAITLAVTILFGGGYYLKNVVLRGADGYTANATFLIEYADENWATNLKYVNEYSWNLWMESDVFQEFVKKHLPGTVLQGKELGSTLKATVPSDLRVVRIAATALDPVGADTLLEAVKTAMTEDFPSVMEDIAAITVTDTERAVVDVPDVRPVRAFVLAFIVGFLFALLFFVVRELTQERIWLPTTFTKVYGVRDTGLLGSAVFAKNLLYFLSGEGDAASLRVAVVSAGKEENGEEFIEKASDVKELKGISFFTLPCPLESPEGVNSLRGADGVVILVKAGTDAKYLEWLLHFLDQQAVIVTACTLWKEDRWLVNMYYKLGWLK